MGEALAYLLDYLGEGAAEATAGAGEAVTAATAPVESANVAVDTSTLPETEEQGEAAIETTPKPRKSRAPKKVTEAVQSVKVPDIKNLPTPGGISFLLFFILFILFAIKPVSNGMTRLGLMWAALRGEASLGDSSGGSLDGQIINTPNPDGSPGWTIPNDDWTNPPAIGSPSNSIGSQWGGGFY
jgi:hypothetical protein